MQIPLCGAVMLAFITAGPLISGAEGLTIFAAASTIETVQTVARAYESAFHVCVTCSFGSSSTLAKQIDKGAPADLFLSADAMWMDYLAAKQLIVEASRVDLLANSLVLIAPVGKPLTVTVEKGFPIAGAFAGRLAIGDPTNVPAGIYAKEAFTNLGWWESLHLRLAPAADVRAALKLVEMGEMEVGVVYATDAKASAKVTVAAAIPENLHHPIRYPVALTATAKPAAAAFLSYLQGPAARAVFDQAGFTNPGKAIPAALP